MSGARIIDFPNASVAAARPPVPAAAGGAKPYTSQRYAPERVRLTRLVRALSTWQARTGPDGVFRVGRDGQLMDLLDTGVLGPRSMLVNMTGDAPDSWLIAYYGKILIDVTGDDYLVRRFTDLPGNISDASLESLFQVLPEQRTAVHRINGSIHGRRLTYDRLILPIAGRKGPVNGFVTVSERIDRSSDALLGPP